MPQQCSICAHKKRKDIDAALVVPNPNLSGIARIFGVSDDALRRHVGKGHVEAKIAKAARAQEALEADDLLRELQDIQMHQRTIFKEARNRKTKPKKKDEQPSADPDNRLALEALRDQSRIIELKGRVRGAFKDPKQPGGSNPPGAIAQMIIYVPDNNRTQKPEDGT